MTYAQFKRDAFEQAEVTLRMTPAEALARWPNIKGVIASKVLTSRGWHPLMDNGKRTMVLRAEVKA